jgi:succinoglycan biosynthesis transport protein ExoP
MHSSVEKFRVLRVRVQHEVALPALVAVGAALPGDGATYVACGLARAFAEASHHTLLLDANPKGSGVSDELGVAVVGDAARPQRLDRHLSVASLYKGPDEIVPDEELANLLAGARSRYAAIVVDAAVIPGSGAALQLARLADGVLVAVRLGRHPSSADQEMKLLLQQGGILGGTAFCGIVPTRAQKRPSPHPQGATAPAVAFSGLIGRLAGRVPATGR